MKLRNYALYFIFSILLSLAAMSPFMYASRLGIWQEIVDLSSLYKIGNQYTLIVVFLAISFITAIFLNSFKHAIKYFVQKMENSFDTINHIIDQISLTSNLLIISLLLALFFEPTLLLEFNDNLTKLAIILSVMIMAITTNIYLDRRLKRIDAHVVHLIPAVIISLLGIFLFLAIFIRVMPQ